jgi:molybdate transport system ATP-binding protein
MSFFSVKDLSIDLKTFKLKDISFAIERGDYFCIIGPTGAGKTILLETIVGIYKPKSGRITLKNKDITNLYPEKRNIGMIYQDYALFPHLTAKDNIAYGLKIKDDLKIHEISGLLNIDHLLDRFPHTLSGGEQQRVSLARALVVEPELLLMDEPFSALDVQTKAKLRKLISEVSKKLNITIIHITHDLDDVWNLAKKVAIIRDGEFLQFGNINEIMDSPSTPFVADFVGTNILDGFVIDKNKYVTNVSVDDKIISSIDNSHNIGDAVKVAIRPENIILFKKRPYELSARNVIEAIVDDAFIEGRLVFIMLKLKKQVFKAVLTLNSYHELDLKKGIKVFLIIKATTVRIV